MSLPDFLVIGAQKAGSSSIYRYLKAHPQVFMSKIKEPKFFCLNGSGFEFEAPIRMPAKVAAIHDESEYKALFEEASPGASVGEASTWYLHDERAPFKIADLIPNARLIVILRNPIGRAYSNFLHARDYLGIEPMGSFKEAVEIEPWRRRENWGHPWYYTFKGLYHQHLSRFYKLFPEDQLMVCLTQDLKDSPQALIRRLYAYLGLDEAFTPDLSRRYNVSASKARSRILHKFLYNPHRLKEVVRPLVPGKWRRWFKRKISETNRQDSRINETLHRRLVDYYRTDVDKLQDLLGRDLSHWLERP